MKIFTILARWCSCYLKLKRNQSGLKHLTGSDIRYYFPHLSEVHTWWVVLLCLGYFWFIQILKARFLDLIIQMFILYIHYRLFSTFYIRFIFFI